MIIPSAAAVLIPGDQTYFTSWDKVNKYHSTGVAINTSVKNWNGSLPVFANTTGFWVYGWIDTFYDRVIIYPAVIDAGNVTSDVVYDILVSPCYPRIQNLNLTHINKLDPSILVEGFQSGNVESFTIRPYKVTLLAAGDDSIINDSIHWVFSNLPSDAAILPVRGSRSFVFDYKGYNTSSKFEWLTDVLRSKTDETRYSLRGTSRQKYSITFNLMGDKQHEYVERLQTLYGFVWTVPLWHEGTRATQPISANDTTIYLDTTATTLKWSTQAVLISDNGEAVSLVIDSVYDDHVVLKNAVQGNMGKARVFPARGGVAMSGLSSSLKGMNTEVTVEWTIQDPVLTDSTPELTVRGLEVLLYRSRVSEQKGQMPFDVYDPKIAKPKRYANRDMNDRWYSVMFEAVDQKESFETRLMIDRLRGRYQEVYLPTWRSEIILVNDANAGSMFVDVIWKGYASFKDLIDTLLVQTNGNSYALKVANVTEETGYLRITLVDALTTTLMVSEIEMFCQLVKVRPADDSIDVAHGPYCSSVTSINFIEV